MLQKLATKWNRLVYRARNNLFTVENVVTTISLFFCAFFTVGIISTISRNSVLKQKLEDIQAQGVELSEQIEEAENDNVYYNSYEFKELVARDKLNKKAEGETMLYMPQNSEKAKHKYDEVVEEESRIQNNFSKWVDLLFR